MTKTDDLARHAEKMAKKKAAREKIMSTKTDEKGLVIVHTGKGKGKSTAAFGMVFRALGNGMRVGVVQFVKGKWGTGERVVLEKLGDQVEMATMGEGFTWETQDRDRDVAAAQKGWEIAKEQILDPEIGFVLLDEINIALRYDYLDIDEVVEFLLTQKPEMTHVCLTGRNAKPELIEAAGGASITFHRAFDSTPDPLAALETLRELGVNRVLTTGGARRAEEGLAGLGKLVEAAAGRIGILPGGGINHENCRQVVEQTGAREIHVGSAVCSAGPRQEAAGLGPGGIEAPAPGGETDPESVRRLLDLLG